MLFTSPSTVRPELVEGCPAKPFMLRQARHERLRDHCPYNYGLISKEGSPDLVKIYGLRSAVVLLRALQENEKGLLPETIPGF
jgi:hypothetical protein